MVLFCIDLPPQDRLIGVTGGSPLSEPLCRDRLLMEVVCGLVWPEYCVDAPKNVTEHLAYFCGAALEG